MNQPETPLTGSPKSPPLKVDQGEGVNFATPAASVAMTGEDGVSPDASQERALVTPKVCEVALTTVPIDADQ